MSQTTFDSSTTKGAALTGINANFTELYGRPVLTTTTAGLNFLALTNPSAITFIRINADNTVSTLDAATFRAAVGAGTSSFSGAFSALTGKPTTLAGYGITDASPFDGSNVTITGGTMSGVTITGSPISGSTGAFTGVSIVHASTGADVTLAFANDFATGSVALQNDGAIVIRPNSGQYVYVRGAGGLVVNEKAWLSTPADNVLAMRSVTAPTADQTLSIGAASGTGGGVLVLHQSASAPTPSTQDAMFYSLLGEGYGMDGSGNQTLLTPHATDAPADLYEVGPGADHLERKVNVYLATVQFKNIDRLDHILELQAASVFDPVNAKAAWDEAFARQGENRFRARAVETFAEYKTRTGNSLVPAGQDEAWWMSHSPSERFQKVESDRVAKSQEALDAFNARKAAFVPSEHTPEFTEAATALYVAVPAPAFLA